MLIIGIAGGVASGKSLVAEQLQELGAERIDADQIGHEVLEEERIKAAIRDHWGSDVFEKGEVNRSALAKIVFAPPPEGPANLACLEELTHPCIGERIRSQIEQLRLAHRPAVILDAPVMFKAGWHRLCNIILFVDADQSQRLAWARQRGWNADEFAAREEAQEPLRLKRQQAHAVIDNNGTIEATRDQVRRFWDEWIVRPSDLT